MDQVVGQALALYAAPACARSGGRQRWPGSAPVPRGCRAAGRGKPGRVSGLAGSERWECTDPACSTASSWLASSARPSAGATGGGWICWRRRGTTAGRARTIGRAAELGLRTVRDGLRWHLIETAPGQLRLVELPADAAGRARQAGVQVIWDLCHYGWPPDITFWEPEFVDRFARLRPCRGQARPRARPTASPSTARSTRSRSGPGPGRRGEVPPVGARRRRRHQAPAGPRRHRRHRGRARGRSAGAIRPGPIR